ncbi:gp53-like domain-containing protein [Candidatus Binatus soli]|jgi:hypothetical protein|uniref:gp53-like domain-containing protein n=1 Tax=Candidatus Binatus soli TaxID=1953413 RepID=UPI003D0F9808
MATLIDAPEFTSNEVYQIQATDPVEGAASGASFSGTGISNQPHQQLANRTAFLKQRQDVNISNIGVLQAFQVLFTGKMAPNGYIKIPVNDINKGLIQYIIQWGWNSGTGKDSDWTVTWPIAFPNKCVWALASLSNGADDNACGVLVMETVSFAKASGIFKSDYDGVDTTYDLNDGFYWIAIGF